MDNRNNNSKLKDNFYQKSHHAKWGITVVIVGIILIAAYYILNNTSVVSRGFSRMNDVLMPFYLGAVMAYLLCPIYNWTVRNVYRLNDGKFKQPANGLKLARVCGSLAALIVLIGFITGLFMLIVPGLWSSITTLTPRIEPAFNYAIDWIQNNLESNPEIAALMQVQMEDLSDTVLTWIKDTMLPHAETLVSEISSGVIGTIGTAFDMLVGLIICIYILNSKELFIAQSKKITLALFSEERADDLFELSRLTNITFGGFINGKIIDSLVIGVICFILMTLFNMPLAVLISVIVGITNIIPFFGPFIGAIPSTLLILILNPSKALGFILLILALQQFDGNILGPKILGQATRLSSFWVMFAIIVAGGYFGFMGLILGVPVFAVLYTYIARFINGKLRSKNFVTQTVAYEDFEKYNIDKEKFMHVGVYKAVPAKKKNAVKPANDREHLKQMKTDDTSAKDETSNGNEAAGESEQSDNR